MATVYLAEHILLKQKRALKIMSPELTSQPGFKENFIREGQIVAVLKHPYIITIYDIEERDGLYIMAMEYLRGGNLEEVLAQSSLSLPRVLKIFEQVGSALHYAHQQHIIHRDIKPANILFNSDSEAVLTDFGISKLQNTDSELTQHGYGLIGTPRYMSPEQLEGSVLDHRSDLYSLALVFYEMLTGESAIKASTTVSIIREHVLASSPTLPVHYQYLQLVLNKALAKKPDERYSNVREFLDAVTNQASYGDDKTVVIPRSAQKDLTTKKRSGGANSSPRKKQSRLVFYFFPLLVLIGIIGWFLDGFKNLTVVKNEVIHEELDHPQTKRINTEKEKLTVPEYTSEPEKRVPNRVKPSPIEKEISVDVAYKTKIQETQKDTTKVEIKQFSHFSEKKQTKAPEWVAIETKQFQMKIRVSPYAVLYAMPDSQRIGKINKDVIVNVLGSARTLDGKEWAEVEVGNRKGYVKASQLKEQ